MKKVSTLFKLIAVVGLTSLLANAKLIDYRFQECSAQPESIINNESSSLEGLLFGDARVTNQESTLSLNGSGSVQVGYERRLDITKNLTLALWVNPSVLENQVLISRGSAENRGANHAGNAEYFLYLLNGGVKYKHNFQEDADTYSENTVPENKWTHIAVVRNDDRKSIQIYINGALSIENTYMSTVVSSQSEDLVIGACPRCSSNNINDFTGKLDEFKLYNIALTQEEIQNLYESGGAHAESNCPVSPAPTAVNDELEVFTEGNVVIDVLANDIDNNRSDQCAIDGSTLVLQALNGATLNADAKELTVPNEGVWSVSNGTVLFSPENRFLDSPTAVSYRVSDSCGEESEPASVTLMRTSTNGENNSNGGESGGEEGSSGLSIGDLVWYDSNSDGIQDAGEGGVKGVIVVLYDQEGNVVERTQSDENGNYQFGNISKGVYSLGFSNLPDGHIFTEQYAGGDLSLDSDANSVGRSEQFTLDGNDFDRDVGIVEDPNSNGVAGTDNNRSSHESEDCTCETYDDSIPSMGQIGVAIMLWLTTLLGLLFAREQK